MRKNNQESKTKNSNNLNNNLFSILLFKSINKFSILTIFLSLILLSTIAFGIPNSLTLQGKLTDLTGSAQAGYFNFTFRIYDAFTGGNNLYSDTNRSVATDANGIYDIILYNLSSLNFSDQYYLGIAVNNDNESIPRINLTSSPYSFRSNISEDLNPENIYKINTLNITGNISIGDADDDIIRFTSGNINLTSSGDLTIIGNLSLADKITFRLGQVIDDLVNGILKINSGLNVTGNITLAQNTLFVDNTSRNVGIGTAFPSKKLVVIGSVNISNSLNVTNTVQAAQFIGDGSLLSGITIVDFKRENASDYLGGSDVNASLIKVGNLSTVLTQSNGSLWNSSGTNTIQKNQDDNVGIGTTSPNDKLEVVGNVRVSGSLNATSINSSKVYARNGTVAAPSYTFMEDADTGIMKTTEDNLTLVTGGSARMTIDSAGKVGIGTAAPLDLLHIENTAPSIIWKDSNADTNKKLFQFQNSEGSFTLLTRLDDGSNPGGSGNAWTVVKDSNGDIDYQAWYSGSPNAIERMRLDQSGNLGIGTTAPSHMLEITGDVNFTNNTFFNQTLFVINGLVGIGDATPNDALEVVGNVRVSGSLNATSINITERLIVNNTLYANGSRVGIGTSSPADTLDVLGDVQIQSATDSTTGVQVLDADGGNPILNIDTTNEKVGIGTESPGRELDIERNAAQVGISVRDLSATGIAIIELINDDGSGVIDLRHYGGSSSSTIAGLNAADGVNIVAQPTANQFIVGTFTDFPMVFTTNSLERMRISNTGSIGINTTGPGELLDLKSAAPELRFNDSDNSNYFDIGMSGTKFKIFSNDTSASGILIDQLGNVGIGATSPNSTLVVAGEINVTGTTKNSTFMGDVEIRGTLYGSSPVKISGGINVTSGDIFVPQKRRLSTPLINHSEGNLTLTSGSGSIIIRLG